VDDRLLQSQSSVLADRTEPRDARLAGPQWRLLAPRATSGLTSILCADTLDKYSDHPGATHPKRETTMKGEPMAKKVADEIIGGGESGWSTPRTFGTSPSFAGMSERALS